ncbi:recombinase family protein [Gammaproteobacteria bacterium]|nr:recombinase family protein [Gammaproteobacteria bacterium]
MLYLHEEKGLGYRKISYKLNEWGIKTPRGKKWFNTSVHSVLKRRNQRDFRVENQRNKQYPLKIGKFSITYRFLG